MSNSKRRGEALARTMELKIRMQGSLEAKYRERKRGLYSARVKLPLVPPLLIDAAIGLHVARVVPAARVAMRVMDQAAARIVDVFAAYGHCFALS